MRPWVMYVAGAWALRASFVICLVLELSYWCSTEKLA